MTDSDLDIDPTLDAHLRRTLREVAATVDAGSPADPNVVRLVPTSPPSRPRRWRWIAAAAVAGLASGAALMAVADRDDEPTAIAPTSTVPQISTDGTLMRAADQCRDQIIALRTDMPSDFGQPLPEAPTDSTILAFDTELAWRTLLVLGSESYYVCDLSGPTDRPTVTSDYNVLTYPAAAQPTGGAVQVVDRTSMTGADPYHGPGWVTVIGRVGDGVESIELELPDGLITPGQIHDGWFVLGAPLAAGERDGDERVNWTDTAGERQSSRADLLDPPDQTEACAALPDCVTTSLAGLLAEAEREGRVEQAVALEDLDVTREELIAAQERFADCVNAADVGVTVRAGGDGSMEIGGPAVDHVSADWNAQNDVQQFCGVVYLDLVGEAFGLLRAQERVAEG